MPVDGRGRRTSQRNIRSNFCSDGRQHRGHREDRTCRCQKVRGEGGRSGVRQWGLDGPFGPQEPEASNAPAGALRHRRPSAARRRPRYRPGSSRARHGREAPGSPGDRRRPSRRWFAKEWRIACGVPSPAAGAVRASTIACWIVRGLSGPPRTPRKSGRPALGRERAEREIGLERGARWGDSPAPRGPCAIAANDDALAEGVIFGRIPSASEIRNRAAPEKREHRRVPAATQSDRA